MRLASGGRAGAIFGALVRDRLLLALAALFPVLLLAAPGPTPGPGALVGMVDGHTIGALTALMVLSRALEASGALDRVGRRLVEVTGGPRGLAAALVLFSAVLAALLTNDVALFIVVPLTVGLRRRIPGLVGRLVVFEALAVNAGAALTPIGNPQNLYLWNASGVGFAGFSLAMQPLATALVLLLLVLVPLGFPGRGGWAEDGGIATAPGGALPPVDRRLVALALPLYPVALFLVDRGFALEAAAGTVVLFLARAPGVLRGIDWPLLLVFVLFFVNVGILATLPAVEAVVATLLGLPGGAYTAGTLASQGISNVPATLLLDPFTDDWRALAWGVNVGGFGLAVGSLANLIALRLGREPGIWREFHLWSIPVLLVSAGLGAVLLAPGNP